jgi:hypothetical protein
VRILGGCPEYPRVRMAATFLFAPGSDKIVCERPYVDPVQIARSLGLA